MNLTDTQLSRRTACKTLIVGALACAAGELLDMPANAAGPGKLPRITPEAAGIDPQAIAAFIDVVITIGVKTNVGFGPTTHPDVVGYMV